MPYLPLASASRPSVYNGERALNMFGRPSQSTAPLVMLGRSGLELVQTLGGAVRDMTTGNDSLWIAAGGKLWSFDGTTATSVGSIPDDENTQIAVSATEVAVAARGGLWVYNGTTVAQVTPGAVTSTRGVVHLDNYFIAYGATEGRGDGFQVSAISDGLTWDPLDILLAQGAGDPLREIVVYADRLIALGSRTAEVFYNAGAATGVFRRDGTPVIQVGVSGLRAACVDVSGAYWVGSDGKARRTAGVEPVVISTPDIDENLVGVQRAFAIVDRGHKQIVFWRPDAPSFTFDVDTGLWHERSTSVHEGAWVARRGARLNGVQFYGTDGGIAKVKTPAYTATEPEVMLQQSAGGPVWGGERWRSLGPVADYDKHVRWNGLGAARRHRFRLRVTDNASDMGETFKREIVTPPLEGGGREIAIDSMVVEATTGRAQVDLHGVTYG